jgi:hypothetical protein
MSAEKFNTHLASEFYVLSALHRLGAEANLTLANKKDSQAVCTATVRAAVTAVHKAARDLPLLAGGHSFGGRMTSSAASESPLDGVQGLVFFAFPLHQPSKPDSKRADNLSAVMVPVRPRARASPSTTGSGRSARPGTGGPQLSGSTARRTPPTIGERSP